MTTAWAAETLDVDRLLRDHGPKIAERVLWLGHVVYSRMATDPRYREAGACPLQASLLRDVLGRHHLGRVRDVAEAIGYVGRDRSYRAGERSQSYRILAPHDGARLRRHPIDDATLAMAIGRARGRRRVEQWERIRAGRTLVDADICQYLWAGLQRITLAEFEPSNPYETIVADRLRNRRHWLTVDDYGRIHTALTSMPKTMRRYLRVDGVPLAAVDIGESQPLFLGLALCQRSTPPETPQHHTTRDAHPYVGHPTPHRRGPTMLDTAPPEMGRYLEMCERRGLYQAVADRLGVSRDEAKPRVLAVFFGQAHHRTRASEALDAIVPDAMAAMRKVKQEHGYASLAHWAQRIESGFIYGRCVRRLMSEHPGLWVATIHDAIITTDGSEGIIRDIMADEFARLGLRPTLTVERW